MRKKFIALFLSLFVTGFVALTAQQETPTIRQSGGSSGLSVQFNLGAHFTYSQAEVTVGDGELENTLAYAYAGLLADVDIFDYLTVGLFVGYYSSHLKDPLDFVQLPLSLRFDQEKSSSMVFGLHAHSELQVYGDFSFHPRAQFLFFKSHSQDFEVTLPIASGTGTLKHSLAQLTVDLLGQYDGFQNMTLYLGPQLNLLSGKYTAAEAISTLQGEEDLDYKQKNLIGVVAGANFDLGNHFIVDVRAVMLSKMSISASIFYVF